MAAVHCSFKCGAKDRWGFYHMRVSDMCVSWIVPVHSNMWGCIDTQKSNL